MQVSSSGERLYSSVRCSYPAEFQWKQTTPVEVDLSHNPMEDCGSPTEGDARLKLHSYRPGSRSDLFIRTCIFPDLIHGTSGVTGTPLCRHVMIAGILCVGIFHGIDEYITKYYYYKDISAIQAGKILFWSHGNFHGIAVGFPQDCGTDRDKLPPWETEVEQS